MRRFFQDRRGNVAMIFALSLIPIAFVVGASVDLSRMRGERTKLQAAVDSAALAAANLPAGTEDRDVDRTVRRFVESNFDGVGNLQGITITRDGSTIGVNATANVPLTFTSMLGSDYRAVTADAEATRSFSFFEVVMVLDNSGSMRGSSKIGALRTAANSLVETMSEAETEEGSVKIGLVPFTIGVNVGRQYANAAWMDHPGLSQNQESVSPEHDRLFTDKDGNAVDVNRFDLFDELGVNWAGCVDTRVYPLDVTDVPATVSNPSSLFVPYFAPDEPDSDPNQYNAYQYPNNYLVDYEGPLNSGNGHGNGNGNGNQGWTCTPWYFGWFYCTRGNQSQFSATDISDNTPQGPQADPPWWAQSSDYNSNNAKRERQTYRDKYENTSNFGGGRGPNYQCNVKPLMPLTNNFDALEDAIDDMDADGYTNVTQGTMWGWRLLSPAAPFTEGAAYDDPDTKKFLIVLTDGTNNVPDQNNPNHNKSIYSPYAHAVDGRLGNVNNHNQIVREMDDRMEEICDNIKSTGITVYTIAFDVSANSSEAELMRYCATDAARYFNSPNAASLQATFDAIVKDITQLRLSR